MISNAVAILDQEIRWPNHFKLQLFICFNKSTSAFLKYQQNFEYFQDKTAYYVMS